MGVQSFTSFAERCARMPATVNAKMPALAKAVGEIGAGVHRRVLARYVSGGKLRGVGKHGAHVGIKAVPGLTPGAVTIRAIGPLQLLERDTRAHSLAARTKRNRPADATADAGEHQHPGTRGKHPFALGAIAAEPAMRTAARAGMGRTYRDALKG